MELSFQLRNKILGRVRLRAGLPNVHVSEGELEFYKLLLDGCSATPDLVVDIGCRNWSYVSALSAKFPGAALLGIELDGLRRYWTMYRRIDAAEAFAQKCGVRAKAMHGDILELKTIDLRDAAGTWPVKPLFTAFFPFVSENPCVKWGVPSRYADYGRVVRRIAGLCQELTAPVSILSVHQGEWEAEIASKIYQEAGLSPQIRVIEPDKFAGLWPSRFPVHIFQV